MIAMRMRKTAFRKRESSRSGTKFTREPPEDRFTLHRDCHQPAVFLTGASDYADSQHPSVGHPERLPHKTVFVLFKPRSGGCGVHRRIRKPDRANPISLSFQRSPGIKPWLGPYEKGTSIVRCSRVIYSGCNGPIYYIAGPSGMVHCDERPTHSSGVSDDDLRLKNLATTSVSRSCASDQRGAPILQIQHYDICHDGDLVKSSLAATRVFFVPFISLLLFGIVIWNPRAGDRPICRPRRREA